jgi:hypothetical protein
MRRGIYKKKFKNDPLVILTPEDFTNKILPGQVVWAIEECICSLPPNSLRRVKVLEYNLDKTRFKPYPEYDLMEFVSDCFWCEKCVCLTEEKGIEVLNYLHDMFKMDKEWQKTFEEDKEWWRYEQEWGTYLEE